MKIGIAGMAMKTCLGNSSRECHEAFCRGEDGNAELQAFEAGKYNTKHAYEIKDRPVGRDRPYRAGEWLTQVIREAVADAGIDPGMGRTAVFVGTGLRELRSVELWHNQQEPIGLDKLHFFDAVAAGIPKACPVYTLCNACSASSFTLAMAMDMLEGGTLDYAIAAGVDSITESMFGLLDRVNPLHPRFLRTFNQDRRGVVMGEGAAAVVLSANHPAPKAWLKGVGLSCDAYQDTAPHHDGLLAAMRNASERSGVTPDEIDLLFAHGTGTYLNDQVEAGAAREFFGAHSEQVMVTGVKPNVGHTSGASALVSLITAVESLRRGFAPPILGLQDPIEAAAGMRLLYEKSSTEKVRNVQVNAFGFGGVNAVAILSRS